MIRSLIVTFVIALPTISFAQNLRFEADCGTVADRKGIPVKNGAYAKIAKFAQKGADGKWADKYQLEETDTATGVTKSFEIISAQSGDADYNEFYVKGSKNFSSAVIQNKFRWATLSGKETYNNCEPIKVGYKCEASANSNRGYPQAFNVGIKSLRTGSEITFTPEDGKKKVVGKILGATTLFRRQGPAFDNILGLFGETDVSGLTDREEVDRIELIRASREILIIRFYKNKTQIGGAFSVDLHATACLE